MSQTVITSAFEQLKAQEAANGGVVILDEFVFANIPNLDITSPVDRGEGLPDEAMIVHRQAVGKTGMVNNNAVVYSVVLGADVGDFDFNWVGLVNSANKVVAMIVHAPTQKKIKTATGQQGNVLTRSFLMEYNGASEQTQIITPADTWQIDFTARLNGVDERIRLENMDIYGAATFFDDGFLVASDEGVYSVRKGLAYVAGQRAELLFDQVITVSQKPLKVWVDVSWKGTLTSVWNTATKITVAPVLENYTLNDEQHYVYAVAEVMADGTVVDLRNSVLDAGVSGELKKKQPLSPTLTALAGVVAAKDKIPYFSGDQNAELTGLTETGRNIIGSETAADALHHLGLKGSGTGSEQVDASEYFTVSQILKRMMTLSDKGVSRPLWGFDGDNDVQIYNQMADAGLEEILLHGGLHIAKKFRGVSRFATVLGIRGGRASYNDSAAWRDQVTSVTSVERLSSYGLHDGVGDFGDATLPALEQWETVSSALYSANSVTVNPLTDGDILQKAKRGDVIKTRHSPKIWGVVDSVDAGSGKITVVAWAKSGVVVTPENDGSGFYINFIDKAWAFNRNILIPANAAGSFAVIGEIGAQIKKVGMGYVNGLDSVLLDGSVDHGTAAFLARSGSDKYTWLYGYNGQGNRFNFYSTAGKISPYAGFMETSDAVVGMKFRDKNTYSMAWSKSSDLTDVSLKSLTTIIGPAGHVYRRPERIISIDKDTTLQEMFPTVYVTQPDLTITMPDIDKLPVAGYKYKLRLFRAGAYKFKTYDDQTYINGYKNYDLKTTEERQTLELQFDGTYWQAF